ncbi:YihY/virulence factor BrkB family protein [candidate division WOR-3 bacterium]|nr:YihY/virulence factor BrkB family protein [candidate division WOR-3 bacterium]
MKTLLSLFPRALNKFNSDRCTLLASALVHATIFSLFPLILGLISFSLYILGSSDALLDKVLPLLRQVFPVGIDEIARSISAIKQTSIALAIGGIFGFFWGTASVFRALESTLNVVWKIERDRPFWRRSLLTIGSALILFLILIFSVGITVWTETLGTSPFGNALPIIIALATVLLIGLVYYRFPNRPITFSAAFFGAIVAGILFEAAKYLFSYYISKVVDYSKIFGPISVFFLLFLWIYYAAFIFLYGAELSYVFAYRKEDRGLTVSEKEKPPDKN